jgi:hypothetical protein
MPGQYHTNQTLARTDLGTDRGKLSLDLTLLRTGYFRFFLYGHQGLTFGNGSLLSPFVVCCRYSFASVVVLRLRVLLRSLGPERHWLLRTTLHSHQS